MTACTGADSASMDRCCGTCAFWQKLSQYEGICTSSECLSGMLDITEVRYLCSGYEPRIFPTQPQPEERASN
jgi:hypothetical protein